MPYLLERHKVQDYERWRRVFDADAAGREAAGCRGARIFRNALVAGLRNPVGS